MRYDIVIVGCGITGITLAHLFGVQLKKRVFVIERRSHIGGQCFDFRNDSHLLVNKYGAHIFHTVNERVWRFVQGFGKFNDYVHFVNARYGDDYFDWPITLDTINRVYGTNLDAAGAAALLKKEAKDGAPDNFENAITCQIGVPLYEMFIKNYSEKMWGRPARELSSNLAFRVPIRLSNDKRLFTDPFQGLPELGYTELFRNMLDCPRIEVALETDYRAILPGLTYDALFVTSPIDEYYNCCYGSLAYRGMRFEWESPKYVFEIRSFLGLAGDS